MASGGNRRRNRKRRHKSLRALWGSLFRRNTDTEGDDVTHGTLYENDEDEIAGDATDRFSRFKQIWVQISLWKLIAGVLFVILVGSLFITVYRMWSSQDISDIEGFHDNVPSRNLARIICTKTAVGEPIIIREDDVNRYLRDTCCIKQDGFFSIFAEARGVAFRFHKGYAELVIERAFGPLSPQVTTVNISFEVEITDGQPHLKAHLRGGDPIWGSIPRGGSIGSMAIPQKHIVVLQPALESLLACYPEIRDAIIKHGYCPYFEEGRVELRPYPSPNTTDNQ